MKKIIIVSIFTSFFMFAISVLVYAEEQNEQMNLYDFSEIEKVINDTEYSMGFEETMSQLASGQSEGIFLDMINSFINELFGELIYNKEIIVKIIIMAISLALLNNLATIFNNGQISETGFFAIYCMIITILISGFVAVSEMVVNVMEQLMNFMYALVPALMMALGFTGAYTSQSGFCQLILIAITVVEKILMTFVLPAVNIYVVLMLINSLVNEDYISKLAGLVDSFVKWFIKTVLAVFLGMNLIQGMILPSVDAAKLKGIQKLTNVVGGNVVGDVLLGTSNVIKNAVGSTALIFIIIIVAVPVIKVFAFSVMYKITAAVIQPVSDKRVITAVESVANGANLLYKIVIFTGVLFGISVAIMCIATNNMG